jgi:hypothetical protein
MIIRSGIWAACVRGLCWPIAFLSVWLTGCASVTPIPRRVQGLSGLGRPSPPSPGAWRGRPILFERMAGCGGDCTQLAISYGRSSDWSSGCAGHIR